MSQQSINLGLVSNDGTGDPIRTALQKTNANFTEVYGDLANKIPLTQRGAVNGVATLDAGGKIPSSQLPSLSLTTVSVVANSGAMIALVAQQGDVAIRTDLSKTFVRNASSNGDATDWTELQTPTDSVLSVAGRTGVITLTKTDVGLANVDNTSDANKPVSTATTTALDGKAATGIIAASGLTSATATITGRTTAGTGAVEELTGTQATALLNSFTLTSKGLVPAPSTLLGKFLKDDGTWATPATAVTFQDLSDTDNYSVGDSNKIVVVKNDGSGITLGPLYTTFAVTSHFHSFNSLTDVADYSVGDANKVVKINSSGTGVDLGLLTAASLADAYSLKNPPISNQTTTSYTLVLGDDGKYLRINDATVSQVIVPLNSSVAFPVGAQIRINQAGAGPVSITPVSGVTVNSPGSPRTKNQYDSYILTKVATNTWDLSGDGLDASNTIEDRAATLKAKVIAAAGGVDKVKFLTVPKDDLKTTYAGQATFIQTLTPSVGPVLNGNIENPAFGRSPRIVNEGVIPNGMFTGTSAIILPDLKTFSIDIIVIRAPIARTFATITAMTAVIDTVDDLAHNEICFVESVAALFNDTEGYGQPPLDTFLGLQIDNQVQVNRGYYRRVKELPYYNTFFRHGPELIGVGTAASGYNVGNMGIDAWGRPLAFLYANGPSGSAVSRLQDTNAYLPGAKQSYRISCINGNISLFWNGVELSNNGCAADFPVNQFAFNNYTDTLVACCANTADTMLKQNAVSNVLAERFGTAKIDWPEFMDLFVHRDQSRTSAAPGGTTGDALRPDPTSNYNGELTPRDGGDGIGAYDNMNGHPTRTPTPGLYCGNIAGQRFGTFAVMERLYGHQNGEVGVLQSTSSSETIEAGIWAQYRKWGGKQHLLILGCTIGGFSHAGMVNSQGINIHKLPDRTFSEITYPIDAHNKLVKKAQIWAKQRGQKLRLIGVADLQAETDVGQSGISTVRENDFRTWVSTQLTKLVDVSDPPPILMVKTASYSFDGVSNGSNTAGVEWRDDKQRRIGMNGDGEFRFYCISSYYAWLGRWIHHDSFSMRKLAEAMGYVLGRSLFYADDEPLQAISAVRSGTNIVVTMNKPVDIVAQMLPTVLGIHQTGGFNTYGMVYTDVGGAKTISGNVTLSGDGLTITVPISGGGADAGDYLDMTGTNALWTNFKSREVRTGVYQDQNWGTTIPYAAASPVINPGALNDISEWAAPAHFVLS